MQNPNTEAQKKKLHEKVNFFCFCGKEKEAHRGTAAPGGVCGGARRNSWRRIAGDRRRPRSVTVSRRAGTACCREREKERELQVAKPTTWDSVSCLNGVWKGLPTMVSKWRVVSSFQSVSMIRLRNLYYKIDLGWERILFSQNFKWPYHIIGYILL